MGLRLFFLPNFPGLRLFKGLNLFQYRTRAIITSYDYKTLLNTNLENKEIVLKKWADKKTTRA